MVVHTIHCGDRQGGHRIKANLGYVVAQAYTHEMGCWNILQKEKHIAQRAGRHRRDALAPSP